MKKKAKSQFLARLNVLVKSGHKTVTLQQWQYNFLDGLLTEKDGEQYYNGVKVNLIHDKPEPTTLAR